jgi:hypothetical protein
LIVRFVPPFSGLLALMSAQAYPPGKTMSVREIDLVDRDHVG